MTTNVVTRIGITTTTIHAPSRNFVTVSVTRTTEVTSAPIPLTHMRRRQPGSRSRSQRRTMPLCDSEKERKTPTA